MFSFLKFIRPYNTLVAVKQIVFDTTPAAVPWVLKIAVNMTLISQNRPNSETNPSCLCVGVVAVDLCRSHSGYKKKKQLSHCLTRWYRWWIFPSALNIKTCETGRNTLNVWSEDVGSTVGPLLLSHGTLTARLLVMTQPFSDDRRSFDVMPDSGWMLYVSRRWYLLHHSTCNKFCESGDFPPLICCCAITFGNNS